jgi:hypothetical protein
MYFLHLSRNSRVNLLRFEFGASKNGWDKNIVAISLLIPSARVSKLLTLKTTTLVSFRGVRKLIVKSPFSGAPSRALVTISLLVCVLLGGPTVAPSKESMVLVCWYLIRILVEGIFADARRIF